MSLTISLLVAATALSAAAVPPNRQASEDVQLQSDIPAKWSKPLAGYDYVERDEMVPMRDGVKLHRRADPQGRA